MLRWLFEMYDGVVLAQVVLTLCVLGLVRWFVTHRVTDGFQLADDLLLR